ncbi:hypothetical protein [Pedobacter sp. B4-66]|uniref:hypothetical protein n=1 Tax=Pedobacter sp. B4-66 TaxID=2817280 RepID=UPI001BD99149|nr:hypothetical protein [Pedobacter sp. B4-66]
MIKFVGSILNPLKALALEVNYIGNNSIYISRKLNEKKKCPLSGHTLALSPQRTTSLKLADAQKIFIKAKGLKQNNVLCQYASYSGPF